MVGVLLASLLLMSGCGHAVAPLSPALLRSQADAQLADAVQGMKGDPSVKWPSGPAAAGTPIATYDWSAGGSGLWDSIGRLPAGYIVPVLVRDRVAGEFEMTGGGVLTVGAWPGSRSMQFLRAGALLRRSVVGKMDLRALDGAWPAVVARDARGQDAVVFCRPNADANTWLGIKPFVVYRAPRAFQLMRQAY